MIENFLNDTKSIEWLFDTHIKMTVPNWVKSFIISVEGNEDSPKAVYLFDKENPNFDEKPIFKIVWD